MSDPIILVSGIVTLVGSIAVSFSMERSAIKTLSAKDCRLFFELKRANRHFRTIALALLVTYLLVRIATRSSSQSWSNVNVLFLWTSYNLTLWIKMRRMMSAFADGTFPVYFQISYIFSQITAYIGLVSSMLVLLHGGAL